MLTKNFNGFFHSDTKTRDKFLSRLFGIFNEEIVRIWCHTNESKYVDLGRPTVKLKRENEVNKRGRTFDYTFEHKESKHLFIGECKCWLEYEDYKYLKLDNAKQLDGYHGESFTLFKNFRKESDKYEVKVNNIPKTIDGMILIWGAVNESKKQDIISTYGFEDILSLENIISELIYTQNAEYADFIQEKSIWCEELFGYLLQAE